MNHMVHRVFFVVALFACGASMAAAETTVTLRLLRADSPGETVSTAVTKIAAQPDAPEGDAAPAGRAHGKRNVAADIAGKPAEALELKIDFDRYTNYMRGIVIDGEHEFQRSYQGSFLGRADTISLKLKDGEHTIEPGGHRFEIAGEKVTAKSESLAVDGTRIDVAMYPVTVIAVDGSAVREMPAEVRRLPVSPRLHWGTTELLPKEKDLSPNATFKRLTLYMLPNPEGKPYRLHPSDTEFRVTASGLQVLDGDGAPTNKGALTVENQYTLVLPKIRVPLAGYAPGVTIAVSGPAGQARFVGGERPINSAVYLYPAVGGAEISAGYRGRSRSLPIAGDFDRFALRSIAVEAGHADTREPRVMVASLPRTTADAGATLPLRVDWFDALDAPTITPAQVAAYVWATPVLADNGQLQGLSQQTIDGEWRAVRVKAGAEAGLYEVVMPDWPSNVYRLRIVVDRYGACSPSSPLRADFIQAIVHPNTPATLSLFCPIGRHAFFQGGDLELSAVVKTAAAVPAGELSITLERNGKSFLLAKQAAEALAAGRHLFHFQLAGIATSALEAGDYTMRATLGSITSNRWTLRISPPRYLRPFPMYDDGWSVTTNVDEVRPAEHLGDGISRYRDMQEQMQRNASVLGDQNTLSIPDHGLHGGYKVFQGRDSSSEVAQVERLLRDNMALPAHEVYAVPSNWELMLESLSASGMGLIDMVTNVIAPYNLIHTLPEQVDVRKRQYQLVTQIGQKFEAFRGMALLNENSIPTGYTEASLIDPDGPRRWLAFAKKFKDKYKFEQPAGSDVLAALRARAAGKATTQQLELLKHWEAWYTEINALLPDYYRQMREACEPLQGGVKLAMRGPSWGPGGVNTGTFPERAHRHQSPLTMMIGIGDYGQTFSWQPLSNTRMYRMAGEETWACQGMFGSLGFYNLKQNMAAFLAGGAKGYGYRTGWDTELQSPRDVAYMGIQEERQDMARILATYGPMFQQMEPTAEIGVWYSFDQASYDVINKDLGVWSSFYGIGATEAAILQLALSGYNSVCVSDQFIAEGRLKELRAVVVPYYYYASPKNIAALEKFAADGGLLIVGGASPGKLKGETRLADDFLENVETLGKWGYNALFDEGHAYVFGELRRKAVELRKVLGPKLQPFVIPSTDRVMTQTSAAGVGRYTICWSALYPSFLGTERVMAEISRNLGYEANENTLMPLKEQLSFPANCVVYELFSQRKPTAGEGSDGRQTIEADLSVTPFRVFVSLPSAIESLRVEAPEAVVLGSRFTVKVTPLDGKQQPIDASIPILLMLSDAEGKVVHEQTAAAWPSFELTFPASPIRTAGAWKLDVRELVSGRQVTLPISVTATEVRSLAAMAQPLPAVQVERRPLVSQFLKSAKDAPVLVLLEESQQHRRPVAEKLVAGLKELGIKATISSPTAPGVTRDGDRIYLFPGWSEMRPNQFIDKHLVLLGHEGESVLLEELQESQLLKRPLTDSYPGPGRGLISLVRSPFAYGFDVLCVLGKDDAGLQAAVADLARIGKEGETPAAEKKNVEPAAPLKAHDLVGELKPGSEFETMDGSPVERVVVSADGNRIGFGVLGYAKNLFVFDAAGKLLVEDKIGHIHTHNLVLVAGQDQVVVQSDANTFLRNTDGSIGWRIRQNRLPVEIDPQGRYVVVGGGTSLAVYGTSQKLLWQFDEWDQYESTELLLAARTIQFVAFVENGDTLVYRLKGKAPGIEGTYADELVFCDPLTGTVRERRPISARPIADQLHLGESSQLSQLRFWQNGKLVTATIGDAQGRVAVPVLLDDKLQLLAAATEVLPTFLGGKASITASHVLPDRRLVMTVGDAVLLWDPAWKSYRMVRTSKLIMSLAVDDARGRIAVSDYSGHVNVYQGNLELAWQAPLASAAHLAFLPDGRLAAGTLRGNAVLLDGEGKTLWTASLTRYAEPAAVEARWAELEAITPMPIGNGGAAEPWWERLAKSTQLGDDVAKLSGTVSADKPLVASLPGVPFGTYLVEWHQEGGEGASQLTLRIAEQELAEVAPTPNSTAPAAKPVAAKPVTAKPTAKQSEKPSPEMVKGERPKSNKPKVEQHEPASPRQAAPAIDRVILTAAGGSSAGVQRTILRLGDRPEKLRATISASGTGSAKTKLVIRPLLFPSENIARIPSLYRGGMSERILSSPPVSVELFFNTGEDAPHETLWADPWAFVNGRMLESEASLLKGRWFSGGNRETAKESHEMRMPCWIELTFPRKRVVTHVVVAEDPSLPRMSAAGIDAYIETRETRQNLSEFEKRQVKQGYWFAAARTRTSDSPYNVYQLKQPVYTRRLRIWLLSGHASVSEVEVYGAVPKDPKTLSQAEEQ